ncbi:MAG: isoprenylcysteine carboxylmethyltransferase family protein [Planctomycetales bacterium]|nr:isoprenylcysteine carboxylmethyltransferase family protein [Planctomycetales bacterium]
MKRAFFFLYGVACHLLFLAVYVYLAAFIGNLYMPKSIDSAPAGPVGPAVAVNLLLLGLFAAQHSIMARPAFKRVWTRIVPEPIERSTYVLASCLVTCLVAWQWRTIDAVVWDVETPVLRMALWTLFAAGWLIVPGVTLLIDHFDLFGTRQVWLHLKEREYTSLPFRTPLVYKHVRHPLYVGWTILFWATPTMTVGHLLFAVVLTSYMVLAVFAEERDLVDHFGREYEEYRRLVPKFFPRLRIGATASTTLRESQPVPQREESEVCHV